MICIETSHYVCFVHWEKQWIFFDSMANRVCKLGWCCCHCTSSHHHFFFSLQLTRLIYLGLWIAPRTSMSGCTLVMIIRDFWTPHLVSFLNMSEDLLKISICVCISTLMLECMDKVVRSCILIDNKTNFVV